MITAKTMLFVVLCVNFAVIVMVIMWAVLQPRPTPSDLLFTRYFEECVDNKQSGINNDWSAMDLRTAYKICWGQAAMRAESKAYGHKTRPVDEIPMVEVE